MSCIHVLNLCEKVEEKNRIISEIRCLLDKDLGLDLIRFKFDKKRFVGFVRFVFGKRFMNIYMSWY